MAGVLELIRWQQKKSVAALRPLPRIDLKIMELQAAKEILVEVFQIRVSEVDEMILNRYDDVSYEENSSEERDRWPREFQVEE